MVGVVYFVVALGQGLALVLLMGGGVNRVAERVLAGNQSVLRRLVQWVRHLKSPTTQKRIISNILETIVREYIYIFLLFKTIDYESSIRSDEIFLITLEHLWQGASHWSQVMSLPVSTSM